MIKSNVIPKLRLVNNLPNHKPSFRPPERGVRETWLTVVRWRRGRLRRSDDQALFRPLKRLLPHGVAAAKQKKNYFHGDVDYDEQNLKLMLCNRMNIILM